MPCNSITMNCANEFQRKLLTKYIVSSHSLMSGTGNWSGGDKTCKKCSEGVVETLEHFIFGCSAYIEIRWRFDSFAKFAKNVF